MLYDTPHAFLLPAFLSGGMGPAPGSLGRRRPHPDMTRKETIEYLQTLSEETRQEIADSPDGRIDGEEVDHFRIRMKLKSYVERTP